jgi:hypothetical protein
MVTATNGYGSVQASVANGSLGIAVLASVPTGLAASAATAGQINLSWTASSTGTAPITYTVYRSTLAGTGYVALTSCTNLSVLTCSDTPPLLGQAYHYVVTASNIGGTSSYSAEVTQIAMASFAITSAVRDLNKITLYWNSSTGADTYNIVYDTSSRAVSGSYANSSIGAQSGVTEITGLTAATTYYFRVQAVNILGSGAANTLLANAEISATTLQTADQTDDDNTSTGFAGGTLTGVQWAMDATNSVSVLRLNTAAGATNNSELDASWTPQWSSLIGYWKLNEASWNGTANEVIDSSPNPAPTHGVRVGSATTTAAGKLNRAGSFNGSSDYVQIAKTRTNAIRNETISAWVMSRGSSTAVSAPPGIYVILGDAGNGNENNYQFGIFTNDVAQTSLVCSGSFGAAGGLLNANTNSIAANQWYHIACSTSWSGGVVTMKSYLNGQLITTATGTYATYQYVSSFARIGVMKTSFNRYFNGYIDEVAHWSVPLSDAEIGAIYARQSASYAGIFQSRFFDVWTSQAWSSLSFLTPLPFYKELPGASGAETASSSTGYVALSQASGASTLTNGLVGLWHLNDTGTGAAGAVYKDSSSGTGSPAVKHDGVVVGTITQGATGLFGNSAKFNTTGKIQLASLGVDTTAGHWNTVSLWMNWAGGGSQNVYSSSGYGLYLSVPSVAVPYYALGFNSGNGDVWGVNITPYANRWVHLVAIFYNGLVSTSRLFLNGVEQTNSQILGTPLSKNINVTQAIGGNAAATNYYFKGSLDEVAVWSRALTDGTGGTTNEILELYRRGANRLKFQIRSCSASDCHDQESLAGKGWKGPDNTNASYFSELYNSTSNILGGTILATSPQILFSNFSGTNLLVANQRYFQYRTIFEGEDASSALCTYGGSVTPCSPELRSVNIGPTHYDLPVQVYY